MDGARRPKAGLAALREYAALLGDERGRQAVRAMEGEFAQLRAAPAAAKQAVSRAFARQHKTRPMGTDGDSS